MNITLDNLTIAQVEVIGEALVVHRLQQKFVAGALHSTPEERKSAIKNLSVIDSLLTPGLLHINALTAAEIMARVT